MTNKDLIIKKFHDVKKRGFVKSNRKNNTGIGKTFEDLIGVKENNKKQPDFAGFEIKSQRDHTQSYLTLFTKSPSFPLGANTYLKENFGSPYEDNPKIKNLHTSLFTKKLNTYKGKYAFSLINDQKTKRIYIAVYSIRTKKLLDKSCGYLYSDLEPIFKTKLNNLFYVNAETKKDAKGTEYFFFNKADIYEQPSFAKFLDLLDKGLIMFDIRIGSYKSGKNLGKTHDHGSCFRIMDKNLCKLYAKHSTIQ
jgi:hypothetical protein